MHTGRWPTVRDVLGPGGIAERTVPGFSFRPAQLTMAEALSECFAEGGITVVEAPTGVGKTLAYLVPALLSGRRVVVSTHTKTLQDQIVDKDLPALADLLAHEGVALVRATHDARPGGGTLRYALMKGRSNYLCLERLARRTRQSSFGFDDDLLGEITAWSRASPRGDRAELSHLSEREPLWAELDARSETCLGTKCPHYDACFVTRMRQEAESSELIVVNHHLLLADIALQAQSSLTAGGRAFGRIIPPADVLVLDEAHTLEETASEFFGGRVSTRQVERLARDISTMVTERAEGFASDTAFEVTGAVMAGEAVFAALPRDEGRIRIAGAEPRGRFAAARAKAVAAGEAFGRLAERLEVSARGDGTVEALARRVRDLAESMRFVLEAADPDFVYWAERRGRHASLGASPVRVAQLLAEYLYPRFEAVALTSATLSAGRDDLRYFCEAVGVPDDAPTLVLGSPFNFAEQAALYVPSDAARPDEPRAVESLAAHGARLIDLVGGGAFFLFTSYRMMHAVHDRLRGKLRHRVLMQGEAPKRDLIARFIQEAPAVLFATASFWEGVDVPGDPLRLVLIDKLPFDAPNDPVVAARSELLEAGGRSAFAHYQLPRAILRLKQGFGRLVRTSSDRGIVAVLDRRVRTRSYGPRFMASLPPARRFTEFDDLHRWWTAAG